MSRLKTWSRSEKRVPLADHYVPASVGLSVPIILDPPYTHELVLEAQFRPLPSPMCTGLELRTVTGGQPVPADALAYASRILPQLAILAFSSHAEPGLEAPSAIPDALASHRKRIELLHVARHYLRANAAPAQRVADAFGWKIWTANRRIAQAREAGLIPRPEELPELQEAALRAVEDELHRLGVPIKKTPHRERLLTHDARGGLIPTRFAVDSRRADIYRRLLLSGMFDQAQEYLRHLEATHGEDYPTDEDLRFEATAQASRGALYGDELKGYLEEIACRTTQERQAEGGGDGA